MTNNNTTSNNTQRVLWTILDIVLVLIIVLECILLYSGNERRTGEPVLLTEETEQNTETVLQTELQTELDNIPDQQVLPDTEEIPAVLEDTDAADLEELRELLKTQTEYYDGNISIYVQDLMTDEYMEIIGTEDQKAASLIKLYVLAAVCEQMDQGNMEQTDELNQLMYDMITISHNESTNELVRRLSADGSDWNEGSIVVNRYIQEHGYKDTSMGRPVHDTAPEMVIGENYTSVSDCGRLLAQIYKGECVSREFSEYMYSLLKAQSRTNKIPQGVGPALSVANKTGELSDTENDVAIIQLDETHAYILCIMNGDVTDKGTSVANIIKISETVYQYFEAGKNFSGIENIMNEGEDTYAGKEN